MKKLIFASLILLTASALAGFEKWTSKDGKVADLELIKVIEQDGEKAGEFKMRNGTTVVIKASGLSEKDAVRLEDWTPPPPEKTGKPSVFDDLLDRNLVKIEEGSFKEFDLIDRPERYYVFYYTASWCGPCQRFTPSLVEFYEKHKNQKWELVLITSDRTEAAMQKYATDKKMPWPQLTLEKSAEFKKQFDHGVSGIPSVIVCDLKGKNLGNYYDLNELRKLVR